MPGTVLGCGDKMEQSGSDRHIYKYVYCDKCFEMEGWREAREASLNKMRMESEGWIETN